MTMVEVPGPARAGRAVSDTRTLVLSGWSAVTAYGMGRDSLREGVLSGRSAIVDVDRDGAAGTSDRVAAVPGFNAADHLGRKGTRTMGRSVAFAVTAIDQLLRELGPDVTADPERIGLVLGVGQGNVQVAMEFTRGALTATRPYQVDAIRFPDTFLNRAAGHSAIWHRLKGPNTTIAGGRLSALLALSYATRLHDNGHCPRLLVGATEEYSAARAMLADATGVSPELGEGSVVALLESATDAADAGRTPVATVLATHFRACPEPAAGALELAACVGAVLTKAGATADRIRLVAPLDLYPEHEAAGIHEVIGHARPHWLHCRPLLGDAFGASAALQLGAALAVGQYWPDPGDLALVTGIEQDGTVGAALLGRPV